MRNTYYSKEGNCARWNISVILELGKDQDKQIDKEWNHVIPRKMDMTGDNMLKKIKPVSDWQILFTFSQWLVLRLYRDAHDPGWELCRERRGVTGAGRAGRGHWVRGEGGGDQGACYRLTNTTCCAIPGFLPGAGCGGGFPVVRLGDGGKVDIHNKFIILFAFP